MWKNIKRFFKLDKNKKASLAEKIAELIQISIDYKHEDQLHNYISIQYLGWINSISVWVWENDNCMLHEDIDLNDDNYVEKIDRMKDKLLQLIEILKIIK